MSEESDDEFDATKLIVRRIPWCSMCKHSMLYHIFNNDIIGLNDFIDKLDQRYDNLHKAKCVMAKKQRVIGTCQIPKDAPPWAIEKDLMLND